MQSELHQLIKKCFPRYDLDCSGTINRCLLLVLVVVLQLILSLERCCVCSDEELEHLTTNLVFKLGLSMSHEELNLTLGGMEHLNDENSLTLDGFTTWFQEKVISPRNVYVKPNPPSTTTQQCSVYL